MRTWDRSPSIYHLALVFYAMIYQGTTQILPDKDGHKSCTIQTPADKLYLDRSDRINQGSICLTPTQKPTPHTNSINNTPDEPLPYGKRRNGPKTYAEYHSNGHAIHPNGTNANCTQRHLLQRYSTVLTPQVVPHRNPQNAPEKHTPSIPGAPQQRTYLALQRLSALTSQVVLGDSSLG